MDVLGGVQAMHLMKMIHRDLKTANILKDGDGIYKFGVYC
jgi:serine/threonine protein kinase